jgi:hypothetical protein
MRFLLLIISLVLFLLAGLSAVAKGVDLNEIALISFGLASYVAAILVTEPRPV